MYAYTCKFPTNSHLERHTARVMVIRKYMYGVYIVCIVEVCTYIYIHMYISNDFTTSKTHGAHMGLTCVHRRGVYSVHCESICVCLHINIYTHVYIHIQIHMYIYIHTYAYIYTYMDISKYIYTYIYIYVYIYIHGSLLPCMFYSVPTQYIRPCGCMCFQRQIQMHDKTHPSTTIWAQFGTQLTQIH